MAADVDHLMLLPRRFSIALVSALSLVIAACGGGGGGETPFLATGGGGDTSGSQSSPSAPASVEPGGVPSSGDAASARNQLPDVTVIDVATGSEVNLRALVPADNPLVLWFWAPH